MSIKTWILLVFFVVQNLVGCSLFAAVHKKKSKAVSGGTCNVGFADIVAKIRPSVVNISAIGGSDNRPAANLPLNILEEEEELEPVSSLGSGFIISPDGYVVTNYHLIKDAEKIIVNLDAGQSLDAKIVGRDAKLELALLKIEKPGANLSYVSFGDSDKVRVGDWVLAIGNPFRLGNSVTAGIISAKARDIGLYGEVLQTDAAINMGNSGGPMLNMRGEVIGINTAIYSPHGGSVGVGFAIASNTARPVIEHLKNKGTVKRGWIGLKAYDSKSFPQTDGSIQQGVVIDRVTPGSNAEKAGLLPGDIILSINNNKAANTKIISRIVAATVPGEHIRLAIKRQGVNSNLSFAIQVVEEPD
jgi:serine protease Do